jgi:hypothetical protein
VPDTGGDTAQDQNPSFLGMSALLVKESGWGNCPGGSVLAASGDASSGP